MLIDSHSSFVVHYETVVGHIRSSFVATVDAVIDLLHAPLRSLIFAQMEDQGSMVKLTYVTWRKGLFLSSKDFRNIIEDQDYSAGDMFLIFKANKGGVIKRQQEGYGRYEGQS